MRPNKKCRITFEELLDLQDGRADAATEKRLQTHLAAGCQACDAQLAQIGRLQQVMREGELVSAPVNVVVRAKELFRERFVKPVRPSLIAQLVFDSRNRLALSGARGAEGGQIQALYSTDEHDVDLWQERSADGRWYVIGQVLPKDGGEPLQPADAILRSDSGEPIESRGEGGEFHLTSVPAGSYTLHIGLPDVEITAEEIVIGIP
jgi:hypothetical protein